MKDIKAIKGRAYILDLIARGEHEQQDFKYAISDARKIARTISAFANNTGGHLLIGVKDNGVIAGVRSEEDIYMVETAAQSFCVPEQPVEFTAFSTGESGIVIRATVGRAADKPVCVKEEGNKLRAYFRVADENIAAHPLMVRAWRLQSSGAGAALSLGGAAGDILRAVEASPGGLSVEQAVLSTTASRRTAEMAIVRLVSIGSLRFHHTGNQFLLCLQDEDEG